MSDSFPSYQIISEGGCAEVAVKKSRFIATVSPIKSEEAAMKFFAAVKKQYWDAGHNCTAYVFGMRKEITRCSDDGEPSGTAGKPMLEVLTGADVTNTAVVVTRYFGGVLLGTGGLVKAYTQAVQEGLAASVKALMQYAHQVKLSLEYGELGKIQYILGKHNIQVEESKYTEKVNLYAVVPGGFFDKIKKEMIEATSAKIVIELINSGYYKVKL